MAVVAQKLEADTRRCVLLACPVRFRVTTVFRIGRIEARKGTEATQRIREIA